MGDFVRLLLDSIAYIWPFRLVHQWERGFYTAFGRWQWEVGPGLWPVLPWFMQVHAIEMAPACVGTPRQDVTFGDEHTLTFQAVAMVRVVDATKAMTAVSHYEKTAAELLPGVLAEYLARADVERFAPEKRRDLLRSLLSKLNSEVKDYGIEFSDLWFTAFVLNVRTYRLLSDAVSVAAW